jgi:dTDP-4-dehydrorhamnose reductase
MNAGMKRILVTGANGLLGQHLVQIFSQQPKYELLFTSDEPTFYLNHRPLLDYTQLDITSKSDVKSLVMSFHPDVIVNAAAMTNVDTCESQRELAWKINVHGVENLADVARMIGAKIIHVSSDYVFDGLRGPYGEDDRPNPINYYGKTKLASENVLRTGDVHFAIARTIVLYGTGKNVKQNFALFLVNALKEGKPIRAATDQVSNPTYVHDLAFGILRIVEQEAEGVYHLSGSERLSRYEFAHRVASVFGLDPGHIAAVKTDELHQAARRPLCSGFITLKAETELGYKPCDVTQGLLMLKRDLQKAKIPNLL